MQTTFSDLIEVKYRCTLEVNFITHLVGFHNDCILSSGPTGTDTGTFDKGSRFWEVNNVKKSRAFARIQVKGLRGGEVCPGEYSSNMSCAVLLQYVKVQLSISLLLLIIIQAYKLSYLNMEFPYRINEIIKSSDPSDVKCVKDITAALKYNG